MLPRHDAQPCTAALLMIAFARARPALLALTAALALTSCRRIEVVESVVTLEEILRRPPDSVLRSGVLIREVQNESFVHTFYAEITGEMQMGLNLMPVPMSLLVLSGKMDIRVGRQRRVVEAGSHVFIPKRMAFRIRKQGLERLVVACSYAAAGKFQWMHVQEPLAVLP